MTTITAANVTGSRTFQGPRNAFDINGRSTTVASSVDSDSWDSTPFYSASANPGLRDLFDIFSQALNPIHDKDQIRVVIGSSSARLIVLSHAPAQSRVEVVRVGDSATGDDLAPSALVTFDRIRSLLGVTQKIMFAATGIKHRTYHSWAGKPASSRPRLSTVTGLWHLADTIDDLQLTINGSIAEWLHARPERVDMLVSRRFDELVDEAVGRRGITRDTVATRAPTGVALDVDLPIIKTDRQSSRVKRSAIQ